MDAANISLLVDSLVQGGSAEGNVNNFNLVTIHDCFVTDANHVELIHFQVRAAFLRIYQKQEFINDFHSFILNHLINLGVKIIKNNGNSPSVADIIELSNGKTIEIPTKPDFNESIDLKYNLFNSPYFIN
jgi:DNA-directed RNA polymerase